MMRSPTAQEVRDLRAQANLTQTEAAAMVGASLRTWQQWEATDGKMHPGLWDLFQMRVGGLTGNVPVAIAYDRDTGEPIDFTLRKGDIVYSRLWWDGQRPIEVVDTNYALKAGAFRLTPGTDNVVVWPLAGKQRHKFPPKEVVEQMTNPHPVGSLAHDVWQRGFMGKAYTGHPGSEGELWHQAGVAARKASKGGA
ncbi:MAG TPA: hypothetical protein VF797_01535 [Noviherbaspirillum sp.]